MQSSPYKGQGRKKTYEAKQNRPSKTEEEQVPLTCCHCGKVVQNCSQFLLTHEGEGNVETWAGGHWGTCFCCSRFSKTEWKDDQEEAAAKKKFTNLAKRSWTATTKQYKELAIRARSDTWSAFQGRLEKRFPKASDQEIRELTKQRVSIAIDTFMVNFEKESEATKKARVEVHANYIQNLEDMANNPAYSDAQKATGLKFCAEESAWLTRITEGGAVSFGCRNP